MLGQQSIGEDELYDIVVLTPRESVWPVLFWAILAALIVGIAVATAIYFLVRNKSRPAASPAAKAASRISKIKQNEEALEVARYTVALSETLKDYLSEKYADPVRYETAQEYLNRISTTGSKIPDAAQQELAHFLSESEELKFANLSDADDRKSPLGRKAENVLNICESIGKDQRE